MECITCAIFSKITGKCRDNRMGDEPIYYQRPNLMGCSDWKDPKEDQLTLFKEVILIKK